MAKVTSAFWWTVQPGKELDFIEINIRAKKIHMRLGAENALLGRVSIGDNAGQFVYTLTFASGEAYGKFMDAGANDSEWMALWAEGVKKEAATMSGSRLITGIDI
jgi:hypothetical protein